jgi:hypothetical protein
MATSLKMLLPLLLPTHMSLLLNALAPLCQNLSCWCQAAETSPQERFLPPSNHAD